MRLMTLAVLCLLAGLSQAAGLQSDTVTWVAPTQDTDGNPLTVDDLLEYRVYWGTTVNGPYQNRVVVPATATTVDIPRVSPYLGRRCYVVVAVSLAGIESDFSTEVCKYNRKPRPVGTLGVQ